MDHFAQTVPNSPITAIIIMVVIIMIILMVIMIMKMMKIMKIMMITTIGHWIILHKLSKFSDNCDLADKKPSSRSKESPDL